GDALEHFAIVGTMGKAEPFQARGDYIEAGVHRRRVADRLWRPEALGDGCIARPDTRVNVFGADVFRPHGGLTAEYELFLVVAEHSGGSAHGLNSIVAGSACAHG